MSFHTCLKSLVWSASLICPSQHSLSPFLHVVSSLCWALACCCVKPKSNSKWPERQQSISKKELKSCKAFARNANYKWKRRDVVPKVNPATKLQWEKSLAGFRSLQSCLWSKNVTLRVVLPHWVCASKNLKEIQCTCVRSNNCWLTSAHIRSVSHTKSALSCSLFCTRVSPQNSVIEKFLWHLSHSTWQTR